MERAPRPVDVVVNPAANGGRVKRKMDRLRDRLSDAGFSATVHAGGDAVESRTILDSLVSAERDRIIVVGGDGIVHLAANAVAGSATTLGIIAAGSGNDAARALGLPLGLDAAISAALAKPGLVDALEANGAVAVTVATAGFTGTVNERANAMPGFVRPASYLLATLVELPRLRHRRVGLDVDGSRWEIDASLLAVANTAYFGGGMKIAPDANPYDGLLHIVVGMGSNRTKYARLLPRVFSGAHIGDSYVVELTGQNITITVLDEGEPLVLWADGEPWATAPTTIRCRPGALLIAGAESSR